MWFSGHLRQPVETYHVKTKMMLVQFSGSMIMPVKVEGGKMMSIQHCEGHDNPVTMKLYQNELFRQLKKIDVSQVVLDSRLMLQLIISLTSNCPKKAKQALGNQHCKGRPLPNDAHHIPFIHENRLAGVALMHKSNV